MTQFTILANRLLNADLAVVALVGVGGVEGDDGRAGGRVLGEEEAEGGLGEARPVVVHVVHRHPDQLRGGLLGQALRLGKAKSQMEMQRWFDKWG